MAQHHLPFALRRIGSITLLTIATAACNSAPSFDARSSASVWQQIQAETGDASCDSSAQCRSIGIGHKACGGPEGYLAWSSKRNGDGQRLSALVAQHKEIRRAEVEKSGMLSNCSYLPDPGARCEKGRCVLQPAGTAGGTAAQ